LKIINKTQSLLLELRQGSAKFPHAQWTS